MCGIIGLYGTDTVAQELYDGLMTLQHRGQDAAGIMTYKDTFHMTKENGLVRDVFTPENTQHLTGMIGIGHVRYTTAGSYDAAEAQPFYVNAPYGMALVHNGNLTNYDELKKAVSEHRHVNTKSDSEVLLNVLADELSDGNSRKNLTAARFFTAATRAMHRLKGSYSVIGIIAGNRLFAMRDPYGIRPLIFGERKNGFHKEYIFTSETVTMDTLGFKVICDLQPGEVIYIDEKRKVHRKVCRKMPQSTCIFEYVYIARPDSFIDKISIYKSRLRMGEKLARKVKAAKIKIDVVIPVPDTSRSAATTLAYKLGVKCREGLIKNRYIGRTFIMPGQQIRQRSIKYKLNPLELEIRGKNVLLVDDSIVRGNTSRQIVEMVRNAGAKKVYFASCAPALRNPCVYGVDMPTRKEFVANGLTTAQICKTIGADGLFYQDLNDLVDACRTGNPKIKNFCTGCFNGKYPTPEVTEKVLRRAEETRGCEPLSDTETAIGENQLSLL